MGLQLSHREARSLFLPFADQELPAPKAATLRSHLEDCDGCRQGFAQYLETISTLRGMKRERPPVALATQVLRRVRWQNRLLAPRRQRLWAAAYRVPVEPILLVLLGAAAAVFFALYPR